MSSFVYLDTETTGISASSNTIVEIAIVDDEGAVLLNSLINPLRPIPRDATKIHGITDSMVVEAPTLKDLWPEIKDIVSGTHTVIYNADFDTKFFPQNLNCAGKISCAMLKFAKVYGEKDPYGRGFKWQKLDLAARHVKYRWEGNAHRALSDTLACRAVWKWMLKH